MHSLKNVVLCFIAVLASQTVVTHVLANTDIPVSAPPEPTLTVTADTVTGDVVLSWTTTAGPYAVVRSTNPDFSGSVSPAIVSSGLVTTSFRDPVLMDANVYFYSIEDVNTATQVYSMSTTSALPGDSLTLTGLGFDTSSPGANEVFVAGRPAVVTGVTDTTLTFVVPTEGVTGSVVASSAKGADGGRTLYVVATSGLTNISSLGVDGTHAPFLADTGTGATSDKVFKFDPSTGVQTQVGALNEATGLATDLGTPNRAYYGNALINAANFGTIRRTDSSGADALYRACGNSTTGDNCYVFGIGIDPFCAGPAEPAAPGDLCTSQAFRQAFLDGAPGTVEDFPSVSSILIGYGDRAIPCLKTIVAGRAQDLGIEKCASDPETCRSWALGAIGKIGTPTAKQYLIDFLHHSKNTRLLKGAMLSLADLHANEARPELLTLVKHPDMKVRATAVLSLGLIGDRDDFDAMLEATLSLSPQEIYTGAMGLFRLGDVRAIPPLEKHLKTMTDLMGRGAIEDVLKQFKSKAEVPSR